MQLRENARPMTDEEFKAWTKRQEDINWAMRDPSPGLPVPGAIVTAGAITVILTLGYYIVKALVS